MANQKDTPNLPASSRMQMPSTTGTSSGISLKPDTNGVTRKVTKAAAGKGMAGKNPYC